MLRAGSTALLRSGAARSNGTNVASTAANVRPPAAVRPAERRHAGLQDNVRRSPSGIRDPSCAAHLVRCRRALLAAGGEADGGERDTDARHGDPPARTKAAARLPRSVRPEIPDLAATPRSRIAGGLRRAQAPSGHPGRGPHALRSQAGLRDRQYRSAKRLPISSLMIGVGPLRPVACLRTAAAHLDRVRHESPFVDPPSSTPWNEWKNDRTTVIAFISASTGPAPKIGRIPLVTPSI